MPNPILEAIDEWRKGCSNASPGNPEECHDCTVGLIEYIEEIEKMHRRYDELKPVTIMTRVTVYEDKNA